MPLTSFYDYSLGLAFLASWAVSIVASMGFVARNCKTGLNFEFEPVSVIRSQISYVSICTRELDGCQRAEMDMDGREGKEKPRKSKDISGLLTSGGCLWTIFWCEEKTRIFMNKFINFK